VCVGVCRCVSVCVGVSVPTLSTFPERMTRTHEDGPPDEFPYEADVMPLPPSIPHHRPTNNRPLRLCYNPVCVCVCVCVCVYVLKRPLRTSIIRLMKQSRRLEMQFQRRSFQNAAINWSRGDGGAARLQRRPTAHGGSINRRRWVAVIFPAQQQQINC